MSRMQIGCAVIYHENKLLLVKKARGTYKDKWEFPGGKREGYDSTIKKCIKRELMEEIGCDSIVEELIYYKKLPIEKPLHLYFYNVKLKSKNITLSDEHTDYIWTSIEDAKKLDIIKWDYPLLDYLEDYFSRPSEF